MTPEARVLMLGRRHISHKLKMPYFKKKFFSPHEHRSDKIDIK